MKYYINVIMVLVMALVMMTVGKLYADDMEERLPKLVAIEVANKINTDYMTSEIKFHEEFIHDNDSIFNDCIEDAIDLEDLYFYKEQFDTAIVKGNESLKLKYFQKFSKEASKIRDYETEYLENKQ